MTPLVLSLSFLSAKCYCYVLPDQPRTPLLLASTVRGVAGDSLLHLSIERAQPGTEDPVGGALDGVDDGVGKSLGVCIRVRIRWLKVSY